MSNLFDSGPQFDETEEPNQNPLFRSSGTSMINHDPSLVTKEGGGMSRSEAGGIGTGIGGIIGGLIGNQMAGGDVSQADHYAQASLQELLKLGYPPETAKALVLKEYQQAGVLTPALEKSIQAGPSQVAAITEDPSLKNRQMSALNLLSQRATGGGLSPEDRAKFNEIRTQLDSDQKSKQDQIVQQAQMRGMGGSGAELAAALQQQQAGANEASAEGDRIAATASQNALQAALQTGQLGGQIRGQNFDINKAKGSAADEMNRFNVQNQTGQQTRNVGAQNQAQQYNLTNKQNIGNANTGMYNQEQNRQNTAKVTDWNNKRQYAGDLSNAYGNEADRFNKRAQGTRDMYGSIGGAIGGAAGLLSMDNGGVVPGEAKYPGNHPENDTVHAKLSPGEIVIPRHITMSDDAPLEAANYVALLRKAQKLNKEQKD